MHGDLGRHLEELLGVVEDDLHARLDELVGDLLRRLRRALRGTSLTVDAGGPEVLERSAGRVAADGTVTVSAEGSLADRTTYSTPSKAGQDLRGGKKTDGWKFWAVKHSDRREPLDDVRARYVEARSGV